SVEHGGVDLGRGIHVAENTHKHGAARMHGRLIWRDATAIDEPLHKRVVCRYLLEVAIAETVHTRLGGVGDRDVVAGVGDAAHGGAHAGELAGLEHGFGEERVRREQGRLERVLRVVRRRVRLVGFGNALDSDGRGYVATGVTTHAIGHN